MGVCLRLCGVQESLVMEVLPAKMLSALPVLTSTACAQVRITVVNLALLDC